MAGGDELFAGLDAAGGEFEQELAGGMALLADEQDAGVGGVGVSVHGEDDDGAVVADDLAGGADAAGLGDLIAGDPEDAPWKTVLERSVRPRPVSLTGVSG